MNPSRTDPAGERDTRVTVLRIKRTAVQEPGGHIDESQDANWEPATDIGNGDGKLWAAVHPSGSREFFRGQQVAGDITHEVRILLKPAKGITSKMRLRFTDPLGTHVLNIAEPPRNVDGRNHTLSFACVEKVEGR